MENLKIELAEANEKNAKAEHELSEAEKMCDTFLNQLVHLNSKQREAEKEISSLKRTCDNLCTQVTEKDAIIATMRNSVS